jgi:hypothetical protein
MKTLSHETSKTKSDSYDCAKQYAKIRAGVVSQYPKIGSDVRGIPLNVFNGSL